jgi:hypothetical protein
MTSRLLLGAVLFTAASSTFAADWRASVGRTDRAPREKDCP